MYLENVGGIRGRGGPLRKWRDEMKMFLMGKVLGEKEGMSLTEIGRCWVGVYP